MIECLSPTRWKDYELIDSGNFEKLERFGPYTLRRPEPQAVWETSMSDIEWVKLSDASFKKDKGSQDKGQWILHKKIPDHWYITYPTGNQYLSLKISLSSFKHVGLFPEQGNNWDYIQNHCKPGFKVLNLFAYTGGASLAAKACGAEVTHVDSIKQVLSWARDNMEKSNLDNIRWIADDAFKFVNREVRRGNKYQGIILDPPAYGRGPDGEKWVLEEQINEILKSCAQLLDQNEYFFILNVYSLGFSAMITENLINANFNTFANKQFGELFIKDHFEKKLPLGVFSRFHS